MIVARTSILSAVRTIARWKFFAVVVLFPLFFLPTASEFFDWNKTALCVVFALLLVLGWGIATLVRKTPRITLSPLLLPMVLFAIAVIASSILSPTNIVISLIGKAGLYLALVLIFFFGSHLVSLKKPTIILILLGVAGMVLTAVTVLQMVHIGPSTALNAWFGIQLSNTALFNLAGSPATAVFFLLPVMLALGVETFMESRMEKKTIYAVMAGFALAGILLNGYFMMPGKVAQAQFLPVGTGWSIVLETMKNPKTALFGVGPASFVNAFTQFRPASYNLSQQWAVRYTASSNEYFTILTTMGFVGFMVYVLLIAAFLRMVLPLRDETRVFAVLGIGVLVIQLFAPASVVSTILLFIAMVGTTLALKHNKDERVSDVALHLFAIKLVAPEKELAVPSHTNASFVLSIVTVVLAFALFGTGAYFAGRAYAAEFNLFQSLLAIQKNDGLAAYNAQTAAIQLNPSDDKLRRSFASTNYALAKSIANNTATASATTVSDQDKNNITQLIQQAIAQGKAAVALDTQSTSNWETLTSIYKNLIGTAQGADQWTVAAEIETIKTDPTNPATRLDLGGVYLNLQDNDNAIKLFQQAVELKPDWANAYYNLGYVYKQKQDLQQAYDAYTLALQYLDPQNTDRPKLEKEMADLKTLIDSKKTPVTTPVPTQQKAPLLPQGQIRIPENLGLKTTGSASAITK